MQATVTLQPGSLKGILDAIFSQEEPHVVSAYSEYGEDLERFASAAAMTEKLNYCFAQGIQFYDFALWYPSAGGQVEERRVSLDPKSCRGHTFRYSFGGWGVIHVQFDFKRKPLVICSILVNSEKRAMVWEGTYPGLGPVSAWQWSSVEKHAGRLIRKAKSIAQQGLQADAPSARGLS